MRMRELERRSGVNRETIRFYIREGLLPEPERASRNSATYGDIHIARLRAIRRLQDERFLPLGVIRALLTAEDGDQQIDAEAFPHLEQELLARLDGPGKAGWRSLAEAAGQLDIRCIELEDWARVGILDLTPGPGGAAGLNNRDMAIAQKWASVRAHGITPERGFTPDECRVYVEMVEWLADAEIRRFFGHMAGQVEEAEAIEAAEHGIRAINEALGLMRVRALFKRLTQFREARLAPPPVAANPLTTGED